MIIRLLLVFVLSALPPNCLARPKSKRSVEQERQKLGFWHVTDFHVDLAYVPNGDPSNYCHESSADASERSDVGPFGDARCDTPYNVTAGVVDAMARLHPEAKFVIWTGDSAPHLPNRMASKESVLTAISRMTELFKERYATVPVFPLLGNHDYWPADQLPAETDELYERTAFMWSGWLGENARETFSMGGSYSLNISNLLPCTVLLGLNTNLFYWKDTAAVHLPDPAGEFAFMQETFDDARAAGSKVLIIGHVPPGNALQKSAAMTSAHNRRFVDIMTANSELIQGMHFGHTHKDLLMFFKQQQSTVGSAENAVTWLLTAPSVTAWGGDGRNSAVRYVEVDEETGDLRGLTQYYMNFTKANALGHPVEWEVEYSIDIPGEQSSLEYFVKYFDEVKHNNGGAFDRYVERVHVQAPTILSTCYTNFEACYAQYVCGMSELHFDIYDNCIAHMKPPRVRL